MKLRPAFDALFAIDDAMSKVVESSAQPALGAIRLAWWRDALDRLDTSPPPAEPRLQAAAAELLPKGVTGAQISGLADGWTALLDEFVDPERIAMRGERFFAIGATLLGDSDQLIPAAGRLWALQTVPGAPATDVIASLRRHRFPRRLRPLTAMARLAARQCERGSAIEAEGTPGKAAALLSHRLFGKIA